MITSASAQGGTDAVTAAKDNAWQTQPGTEAEQNEKISCAAKHLSAVDVGHDMIASMDDSTDQTSGRGLETKNGSESAHPT